MKSFYLESSLGKDERKFRLKVEIEKGNLRTVQSCSHFMNLSDNTIKKYLKELNISLVDANKLDYLDFKQSDTLFVDFHTGKLLTKQEIQKQLGG